MHILSISVSLPISPLKEKKKIAFASSPFSLYEAEVKYGQCYCERESALVNELCHIILIGFDATS